MKNHASLTSNHPLWLDDALEFCIAKTRHNLATLSSFPERTEGGKWMEIDPNLHGWWVGGHWIGLLWLAYASALPAIGVTACCPASPIRMITIWVFSSSWDLFLVTN
jgi:hypothetical protein